MVPQRRTTKATVHMGLTQSTDKAPIIKILSNSYPPDAFEDLKLNDHDLGGPFASLSQLAMPNFGTNLNFFDESSLLGWDRSSSIDKPLLPAGAHDPLSFLTGLSHYLLGSGEPLHMDFAQIQDVSLSDLVLDQQRHLTEVGLIAQASMISGGMVRQQIDYTQSFQTNPFNERKLVGVITLQVRGTITAQDGRVELDGLVSATKDLYNFNNSPHRDAEANFETSVGRVLGEIFHARPYDIIIDGSRTLRTQQYFGP